MHHTLPQATTKFMLSNVRMNLWCLRSCCNTLNLSNLNLLFFKGGELNWPWSISEEILKRANTSMLHNALSRQMVSLLSHCLTVDFKILSTYGLSYLGP